ncbi:TPA: HK97 family phage prohead protease, partial [Escherichia coli]
NQSSFAFRVARDGESWYEDDEGIVIREITRISRLYDVSPVTYPNKQRGVWVEGSAGVALLARRLGDDATAMDILARLAPLRTRYGYIDSCDYPDNDDMPAWPSSCNTAWMILA